MKRLAVVSLAMVVGLLVAQRAWADVTIQYQVTSPAGQQHEMTSVWKPGAMASVSPAGRQIIRFDKELMWMVDEAGNSYREISFKQLRDMMGMMNKRLEMLPQEQRDKLKAMMEPKVNIEVLDQKKEIEGYPCQLCRITMEVSGQKTITELWPTKGLKYPAAMLKDFKAMQKLSEGQGMQQMQRLMFDDKITKLGVPVLNETKNAAGVVKNSMLLKSFKEGPVDPKLFEVPEGAEKQTMPAMPPM